MKWVDTNCLVLNITNIRELNHEFKVSALLEVSVKKYPGCKWRVIDGSVPSLYVVQTGEKIDLTVLVLTPLSSVSWFVSEIHEINPDALLAETKIMKKKKYTWASWGQNFHHPFTRDEVNKKILFSQKFNFNVVFLHKWIFLGNKTCINKRFPKYFCFSICISQSPWGHKCPLD